MIEVVPGRDGEEFREHDKKGSREKELSRSRLAPEPLPHEPESSMDQDARERRMTLCTHAYASQLKHYADEFGSGTAARTVTDANETPAGDATAPALPSNLSAVQLAERVVEAIPPMSWWRRLWAPTFPAHHMSLPDCCQKCGRDLPAYWSQQTSMHTGVGIMGVPRLPQELIQECLVDGRRARGAQRFASADLIRAATVIADGLRAAHWDAWADFVAAALPNSAGGEGLETLGHALEALAVMGPATGETAQAALDRLFVASGQHWSVRSKERPPTPRRPTG